MWKQIRKHIAELRLAEDSALISSLRMISERCLNNYSGFISFWTLSGKEHVFCYTAAIPRSCCWLGRDYCRTICKKIIKKKTNSKTIVKE